MSPELSSENQQFLEAAVASGAFASRDAAIDRAISLLRARRETLELLRQRPVSLPVLPALLKRHDDGYVSVRGHRIGLHLVLERFFAGDSRLEIQNRFSSLTPIEVDQLLDFVRPNAEALRAYLDQQQAIEQLLYETGSRGPSANELRERWLSKFGQPLEFPCR